MAVTFTVDGSTVGTVRLESVDLAESAELGAVGQGSFTIDDTAGTLATTGWKDVSVEEDDCSDSLTFSGFVGPRQIRRGTHRTLAGRDITVNTADLNEILNLRTVFLTGNRPRESVGDRVDWLLTSTHLSGLVADNGFVTYPSTMMDKNDYRTSKPGDVLADCATRVNFNYFVYPDPTTGDPSLWFADSNTSTNYSSTLRISNVLSDIDWTTTFPASPEATLNIDPDSVYSRVLLSYEGGRVRRTRSATASAFIERDAIAPTSSVKRRARAIDQADKYLEVHRNEDFSIEDTVLVTSSKLNLIRAGMRIQVRYSHMNPEGYSSFTWWRILERRIRFVVSPGGIPDAPDEPLYLLSLKLSPQEEGCSVLPTYISGNYTDSHGSPFTDTFDLKSGGGATTPGNLLVIATNNANASGPGSITAAPAGWNWAVVNEGLDAADQDLVNVFWKRSQGESQVTLVWGGANLFSNVRFNAAEYAGLTKPVVYGTVTENRQDPGVGFADSASTSYPDGPCAVVFVCFMADGPQGGDSVSTGGSTLRTTITGGLHGSRETAIADNLLDTTAGSSTTQFLNTGTFPTNTFGLVFVGENC